MEPANTRELQNELLLNNDKSSLLIDDFSDKRHEPKQYE